MLSYIVTQAPNSLVIFDQHACAERFLFEKYSNSYGKEEIKTKKLLIPEPVPAEHAEFIEEKEEILATFGIKISHEGKDVFISEIPEFSTLRIVDQLFAEIKNIFISDLTSVFELRDKMITSLACHSSIRFGDKLSSIECQKIVLDLMKCKNKLTCPHGRPTYYELPKDKLKEIFKR